jgi:hypothetical protein
MNSSQFVDLEDSLSLSQGPATGPCPEPDECAPYAPTLFLTRALVLYAHHCLGIPIDLFRLLCYVFCVRYLPHSFPPWFDDPNNVRCCVQTTRYVAFSIPFYCFQYSVLSHLQSITITFCWNVTPCFGRCQCIEERCCCLCRQCKSFYPEYGDPHPLHLEKLAHELHNVLSQKTVFRKPTNMIVASHTLILIALFVCVADL